MDNVSSSFEVLRATPNLNVNHAKKGPSTSKGRSQTVSSDAWEVSDADLMAFPALFEDETIHSRKARVISYLRASSLLKDKHKAFCEEADSTAFGTFYKKFITHQVPDKAIKAGEGEATPMRGRTSELDRSTIPCAILSTRSIGGEADNAGMYDRLSKNLRGKKAYVATLQPGDLSMGIGHAIQSILRQLLSSGAPGSAAIEDRSTACHIEALYSFYEEETGAGAGAGHHKVSGGRTAAALAGGGPGGEPQVTPSAATAGKMPTLALSSEGGAPDAAAAGVAKGVLATRELRVRSNPPPGPSAAAGSRPVDLWSDEKRRNRGRPLVLMIQGAERVEAAAMRDLCQLLSQDRGRFPCCLILGANTSSDALLASLPCDVLSRLEVHTFHLPSPSDRLQSFFQDVLLSLENPLPLALAGPCMDWILNRFAADDGSVDSGVLSSLDLALMDHRRSNPLSALAESLVVGTTTLGELPTSSTIPASSRHDEGGGSLSMATSVSLKGIERSISKNLSPGVVKKVAEVLRVIRRHQASTPHDNTVPMAIEAAGQGARAGGDGASRRSKGRGKQPPSASEAPPSADVEDVKILSTSLSEASNSWCEWRLGLLLAHRVGILAESIGRPGSLQLEASPHPSLSLSPAPSLDLSLTSLYSKAASEGFLPPAATTTTRGTINPMALRDPNSSYPGHKIIRTLTGKGSSHSIRKLAAKRQEDDDGSIDSLCEDLLMLAELTMRRHPMSSLVSEIFQRLDRLLKEPRWPSQSPPLVPNQEEPQAQEASLESEAPVAAHLALSDPPVGPKPPTLPPPLQALIKGSTSVHTNASRKKERTAMLTASAPPSNKGLSAAAQSSKKPLPPPAPTSLTFGDKVADLLAEALERLLRSNPFSNPTAGTFAYSGTDELDSQLTYTPRAATHAALIHPHLFLGGSERDIGMGLVGSPLAYRLLMGQDTVDVGRWFQEFCDASVARKEGMEGEEMEEGGSRKKRRGGRRLGRKRSPDGRGEETEGSGGRKKVKGSRKKGQEVAEANDRGEEMDEEKAVSLAGSFCQAVAELQFVGVCRGSKKRKGGTVVQRGYFPPERS